MQSDWWFPGLIPNREPECEAALPHSGAPLKAIYFDNEGHVIHYNVATSTPTSVMFLSEPGRGPQFRLTYELAAGVMTGRFQMHMPGQSDWRTYLEWSGSRR